MFHQRSSQMSIWNQSLAVIPVILMKFSLGMSYGWLAPSVKLLRDPGGEIQLSIFDISCIASVQEIGRLVGALVAAFPTKIIGRKTILSSSAAILVCTWLTMIFIKSAPMVGQIRFMFGISAGLCDVISPVYIAESCSIKLKQILSNITIVAFYCGMLFQFIMVSYLSYDAVATINLINALIVILSTINLKETIPFLIAKNKMTNAYQTFTWLNDENDYENATEFNTVKNNIEEENHRKSQENLFSNANGKNTIDLIIVNILTAGTGYAAIIAYLTIILPASRSSLSFEFTIGIGFIQIVAVIMALFLIDQYNSVNRKYSIGISFVVIGVSHFWTMIKYAEDKMIGHTINSWYIYLGIVCFTFTSSILNSLVQITREELFPRDIKSNCLATMVSSVVNFLTMKFFFDIYFCWGVEWNFLIFLIVAFFGMIYMGSRVPKIKLFIHLI